MYGIYDGTEKVNTFEEMNNRIAELEHELLDKQAHIETLRLSMREIFKKLEKLREFTINKMIEGTNYHPSFITEIVDDFIESVK